MIKLSQLPDRLARDNLEDSDWVTFAVVINKITPQSKNNVSLQDVSCMQIWFKADI